MPKSTSEALFETYLQRIGVPFTYEPNMGGKKPDFGLLNDSGQYQAMVEIEDITTAPGWFRAGEVGVIDPYTPIREKIHQARKHFKYAKHLPCLLVLYDRESYLPFDNEIILAAMLGNLAVSVAINSSLTDKPLETVFAEGGKMLDPQYRRPRNTTISAVAVLEEVCIEQYWSGFQAELQARKDALEVETSDNVGDIHRKLGYDALVAKYEKQGVNLDRKIPRLRLLHNPYARIAWPQHLTSDADESWGWELNHDATCYHMVKVLDGLRPES